MPDLIPVSEHAGLPAPVLVVGSVAYDTIFTPTDKGERILGGSASFAALASSFYAPTRLVGIVGNDFTDDSRDRLARREIDLTGLQEDESGPTFFWSGRYHENFNDRDTLETELNVFEKFRPDLPEMYQDTPYILLANIGPDLQHHVLDQTEGKDRYVVADTMNLWINIMKDELLRLLPRLNLLVLNDDEAEMLTGTNNLFTAGPKLQEMGPETVIIKKGSHGAILFHQDGLFSLPAFPVSQVSDPTGAGDSFVGALTACLASAGDTGFRSIKQAMLWATVTASYTVEAFGCDSLEAAGNTGLTDRRQQLLAMISPE
ncbi:MAG: PfkB family carbohydrate kinase [Opitutales bacterium]